MNKLYKDGDGDYWITLRNDTCYIMHHRVSTLIKWTADKSLHHGKPRSEILHKLNIYNADLIYEEKNFYTFINTLKLNNLLGIYDDH